MILERTLVNDRNIHRFVVSNDPPGWKVREERDSTVIQDAHLHDWRRVELAVHLFATFPVDELAQNRDVRQAVFIGHWIVFAFRVERHDARCRSSLVATGRPHRPITDGWFRACGRSTKEPAVTGVCWV
jgi:hypothetical protein